MGGTSQRLKSRHTPLQLLARSCNGDESFIFETVELCDNIIQAEQHWLDRYSCYNSSLQAHNPMSNAAVAAKQVASLRSSGKLGKQVLTEEQVVITSSRCCNEGIRTSKRI